MNVQEHRSVAQRIAELRRLHEEATAGPWERSGWCGCDWCFHIGTIGPAEVSGIRIDKNHSVDLLIADAWEDKGREESRISREEAQTNAALITATRNLLPVLLAAWEVAEADSFFKARKTVDPRFREAHERMDEARQAYREALKGLHDA